MPLGAPNAMMMFWKSLGFDSMHIAFDFGQEKLLRHIANCRSHSHSWWGHESRPVERVLPGT